MALILFLGAVIGFAFLLSAQPDWLGIVPAVLGMLGLLFGVMLVFDGLISDRRQREQRERERHAKAQRRA